jgi:alanine racemase
VVKADAYGHGATRVSLALERAGTVHGFAVSLVEEGIELRQAGVTSEILVMGPSLVDAYASILEHSLTPLVSDERHLDPLAAAARAAGRQLQIHLKVDTGMHRLGLERESLAALLKKFDGSRDLRVTGIASHLACADVDDPSDASSLTAKQLARFDKIVALCRAALGEEVVYHLANSAGILRFPRASYDLARPGIALYGNGSEPAVGLHACLCLRSKVTQIRHVQIGESVSYGAHWTAERTSTVALVPVGYADGLPRNLSGKGSVLICGSRYPIIGTVSMDMVVVDVTDLPDASIGADVVLIGKQGDAEIRVAEIAGLCDISEYEVTCGISKRVPRTYRDEVLSVDG